MKSLRDEIPLCGVMGTDLIPSEAASRRFHPSLLGFHRALRDFIYFFFHLWYNKHKEVMIMAENKLADMSTEFKENAK